LRNTTYHNENEPLWHAVDNSAAFPCCTPK
jgi:hypothetical protein